MAERGLGASLQNINQRPFTEMNAGQRAQQLLPSLCSSQLARSIPWIGVFLCTRGHMPIIYTVSILELDSVLPCAQVFINDFGLLTDGYKAGRPEESRSIGAKNSHYSRLIVDCPVMGLYRA